MLQYQVSEEKTKKKESEEKNERGGREKANRGRVLIAHHSKRATERGINE